MMLSLKVNIMSILFVKYRVIIVTYTTYLIKEYVKFWLVHGQVPRCTNYISYPSKHRKL